MNRGTCRLTSRGGFWLQAQFDTEAQRTTSRRRVSTLCSFRLSPCVCSLQSDPQAPFHESKTAAEAPGLARAVKSSEQINKEQFSPSSPVTGLKSSHAL